MDAATPGAGGWLTTISDALTVEGNAATLVGHPSFLSSSGILYTKTNVDTFLPPPLGTDILIQQAFPSASSPPAAR